MIDPAQPEAVRASAIEFATVSPILIGLVVLAKAVFDSVLNRKGDES